MIAPAAGNLQVGPRKSFPGEAGAFDKRKRSRISRLNIGFEPVQL